jgi:hypothetical protein
MKAGNNLEFFKLLADLLRHKNVITLPSSLKMN